MNFLNQNNTVVDSRHAPFNHSYLNKLAEVTKMSLEKHHRTMAVILLLRLPEYSNNDDTLTCLPNVEQGLVSRFIESLKAKIHALKIKKVRQGLRVHPCCIHYAWVREISEEGKPHYHAVLFVNHDTFANLGHFTHEGDNLGSLIEEAWLSALGLQDIPEYRTLVHFPQNPLYFLNSNANNFDEVYRSLMFRLSYFAKEKSKTYNKAERSFGCSQRRRDYE